MSSLGASDGERSSLPFGPSAKFIPVCERARFLQELDDVVPEWHVRGQGIGSRLLLGQEWNTGYVQVSGTIRLALTGIALLRFSFHSFSPSLAILLVRPGDCSPRSSL